MPPDTRILLCSSDLSKLEPLRRRLQQSGSVVDCATQAEEARQRLWDRHYAGIAIDLLLADRDGISFALELRGEQPWLPIIVLTTEERCRQPGKETDWLSRSADHARLLFALKQASQRSAGRPPHILHLEHDDELARLVHDTLGAQTHLFRARSAQEARIAMSLRDYDLALVSSDKAFPGLQGEADHCGTTAPLLVHTGTDSDPLLTILDNLRRTPHIHQPAYC